MKNKDNRTPAHAAGKRNKSKKRIVTSIISGVMGLIAVLCIGGGVLIWTIMGKINFVDPDESWPEISFDPTDGDESTDLPVESVDDSVYENAKSVADIPVRGNEKGITNILLLGIDGKTYKSRSDTNMILSINDNTKTIKLISLLRDTYVSYPGRDKDGDGKDDWGKLNAAYAYGGHKLQSAMLEQNFRLKIDQYIGVNFEAFPKVVDAMGGVDIYMTKAELTQVPKAGVKAEPGAPNFVSMSYLGEAGTYHLDGYQALQYARIRHLDSDFKRTERQRIVVEQLMEKAKTMNVAQLTGVVWTALDYVDTNMSSDELLGFAVNSLKYKDYDIDISYYVPQPDAYVNKKYAGAGAVLVLKDPKASVEDLHRYIYG